MYGGPNQKRKFSKNGQPTLESLTKNLVLGEKVFFLNASRSKWLTMGIVPASNIIPEETGEIYLFLFFSN